MKRKAGRKERARDVAANAGRAGGVAAAGALGGKQHMQTAANVSTERQKAKLDTDGNRIKGERIAYCEECDAETVLEYSDLLQCGECHGDAIELWR